MIFFYHISLQDEHGKTISSFTFQKIQYFFDYEEKKRFEPVTFPINEQFSYYQNSKGFQEEDEVKIVQKKYSPNKYIYI